MGAPTRTRRSARLAGLAAGLAAVSLAALAACGGDDSTDKTPTKAAGGATAAATAAATKAAGTADYKSLSGNVVIDGSSTVGPIAEAAAEEFGKVSSVKVSVGISGTGGGFEKFCKGETDISDASRPIKDSEKTACQTGAVEFVEVKVGVDGLTVVANPQNTWASCLTWSQMRKIFDEGSAVNNWNQVDPSFPDQALKIYSPGADSGTFDFFTEEINGKVDKFRNDSGVTFSEDDNVLVQGVQRDKGAIGYFGYAYFIENKAKLKALEVDKDQDAKATPVAADKRKGCIGPSDKTVLDNSYSLSRPLFMYVNKKSLAKPQVKGFLQFVLTNPALVSDVGYVQVPDAEYTAGLARLNAN
jgi:phosphate transport system substrate-binding protein